MVSFNLSLSCFNASAVVVASVAVVSALREIYGSLFFVGILGFLVYHYLSSKHPILSVIIGIVLVASIIDAFKEGISNMRNGIDPDVEEEKKSRRRKFLFRVFRITFFD